ncbi:LysR family transcriptional regulator [Vibrio inusitatus NBRC 102082]|uniref:LysR family transcriptional regulator n=1 Tax=Vibrio inusitatus NBRC 102082 TaxID=1219070 RepID=A0A4Y3HQV4_9VIBR|nr:PACE efflux transporter [Vibrio inusitatus]GEA49428.1 LysR family transcriptional regulator [Vibrio inusitatus NBRC 102082]
MSIKNLKTNRSFMDRIRHTIFFEVGLIVTLIPIGMIFIQGASHHIGILAMAMSLLAMAWNMLFNFLFDRHLNNKQGHCKKTSKQRIMHAVLFELGLILVTVPVLALSLSLTFIEAFIADIGFVIYALFYSAIFNLIYDRLFPISTTPFQPICTVN